MNDEIEKVDLRGLTCPQPVIRTKKLFDNQATQAVQALVDDEVCVNNLTRLASSLKASVEVDKKSDHYIVSIARGGAVRDKTAAADSPHAHTNPPETGLSNLLRQKVSAAQPNDSGNGAGTVIFLAKDTFGEGDPELSRMLVNMFLQTTFESGLRPRAILMANSGVKLLAEDSQVLTVLNAFRDEGVEVLACGLCLEFYKLKEAVPTAQITNMFAICEYLFAADRVLNF